MLLLAAGDGETYTRSNAENRSLLSVQPKWNIYITLSKAKGHQRRANGGNVRARKWGGVLGNADFCPVVATAHTNTASVVIYTSLA